jgi:hypothetical protein
MATSNVQLQQISSQLASLGFNSAIGPIDRQRQNLEMQISMQKGLISGADKNDLHFYSLNLEKLYILQNSLDMLSSAQVIDLLKQKVEILEQLTS